MFCFSFARASCLRTQKKSRTTNPLSADTDGEVGRNGGCSGLTVDDGDYRSPALWLCNCRREEAVSGDRDKTTDPGHQPDFRLPPAQQTWGECTEGWMVETVDGRSGRELRKWETNEILADVHGTICIQAGGQRKGRRAEGFFAQKQVRDFQTSPRPI